MASNSNSNTPDSLSVLESEFSKYGKFTLLDALKDMDVANPEEIVKASTAKSADAMRLQEKSISLEDGAAIAAYFYTGPECVDGAKAPVRNAVNDVLFDFTADKRRKLEKIKRYLYLFLKALRGLQRYHAKNFTLYRNIRVYVDPKVDLSSQLPTVWWDFPYVSTDMSKADDPTFNNFVYGQQADGYIIENVKCIITEKGDGPWGYDVSRYTNAKNNMNLLMEPEYKFEISVTQRNANCQVQKGPMTLERCFKTSYKIKELEPRDDRESRPSAEGVTGIKAESTFYNGFTIAWDKSKSAEPGVIYDVMRVEGMLFMTTAIPAYRGADNKFSIGGLEQNKKYTFRVRRGTDTYWGPWSKDISFRTLPYPVLNGVKCEVVSTMKVRVSWDPVPVCPETKPDYDIEKRIIYKDKTLTEYERASLVREPQNTFNISDLDPDKLDDVDHFEFRVRVDKGNFAAPVQQPVTIYPTLKGVQIVGITYNSVSLRWDPVQYDGGVQYSVSALGKNKKETVIYSGSEPRYAVTNLNPGSQYDFIIRSVLIVDGKPLMVDKMIKVHCETDRIPFPGFWHSGTACTPDPNNKTVIMSNAVPNQHLAAVVYSCLSVTPDVCNDKGVASWRVRILGYGQYSSRDIGIGLAPLNPSGSPSCINPGLFFNCRDWCIYMGTELCSSLVMSNPCGPVINPCDDVVVAYCQKEKYIAFTVKGITVTYNIPSIDTNTNFYPTVIMYSYGDSVEIAPI